MANEEHFRIIKQGADAWNESKRENPEVRLDLSGADLSAADLGRANLGGGNLGGADFYLANLSGANLREADLSGADLRRANLIGADLCGAKLGGADLTSADLKGANLSKTDLAKAKLRRADLGKADLREADLREADLSEADLSRANLGHANLISANLSGTNLKNAYLSGCRVYGISARNLKMNEQTRQTDLILTLEDEPAITVDRLEVAQYISLLLHNEKIHPEMDTLTAKVILILGRFTPGRKAVLDAIREELRRGDYIPASYDFGRPQIRDTHETVPILARLARFVIADITKPKSILQELSSLAETLPSLAIQPLLPEGHDRGGMFDRLRRYPGVLAIHRYKDLDDLGATLKEKVVEPAEAKARELQKE